MKSIWKWKCRPPGGGHFGVGFINQAFLLAKVSHLDKVSFCGTVNPLLLVGIPSNKMERGLSSQSMYVVGRLLSIIHCVLDGSLEIIDPIIILEA